MFCGFGSWSTCPVERCWEMWTCSAWRRNGFGGDPPVHTRKLSRKQSQALHSSAWREGGVRNRKEQIGPEKKGFRLGIRKIFVSVRVVKQWSRLLHEFMRSVSLKIFQGSAGQTALNRLVWPQRGPCFEPEIGVERPWGASQPQWLCNPDPGQSLEPKLNLPLIYFLIHGYKQNV